MLPSLSTSACRADVPSSETEQQNRAELRYLRNKVHALEATHALSIPAPSPGPAAANGSHSPPPSSRGRSGSSPSASSVATSAPLPVETIGVPPRTTSLRGAAAALGLEDVYAVPLVMRSPADRSSFVAELEAMPRSRSLLREETAGEVVGHGLSSSARRFQRTASAVRKNFEARAKRIDQMDSQLRTMED